MSENTGADIRKSPLGSRGLFTTKPCSSGDAVISLDRPLIAVLDQPRIEDACSWCFSWTELPVLSGSGVNKAPKVSKCSGCKKVSFCSKVCQSKAWKAGHKGECKVFATQDEVIPNTVLAVMRILDGLKSGDSQYKAILEMETHRDEFEKTGGKKWETMQLMVHTALKLSSEDEGTPGLQKARTAMCALMCNSHRLVSPTFDPLGLALDPMTAVINHSCSPNAVVVFDGPRLTVRALDALGNGEEVLISYVDSNAPFGVRQAELRDQYFFDCKCKVCQQGTNAPQDQFLEPGADFEERIKVIDDMIPRITEDSAWTKHILGYSDHDKRLSALEFYAYSYLESTDAETADPDPSKFRRAITIIRNTTIWPLSRAPLPALYQQYAVACLGAKRYNEALIAMLRLHILIDPIIYAQLHHPVRIVHAWTLATLAKAVGSDPSAPFCKAIHACGVDLSMLFLGLLVYIQEQVPKSHGSQSLFGRMMQGAWQATMEPGGELDQQYGHMGVKRAQWQRMIKDQIDIMWSKVKTFAEDEAVAAQIDEALVGHEILPFQVKASYVQLSSFSACIPPTLTAGDDSSSFTQVVEVEKTRANTMIIFREPHECSDQLKRALGEAGVGVKVGLLGIAPAIGAKQMELAKQIEEILSAIIHCHVADDVFRMLADYEVDACLFDFGPNVGFGEGKLKVPFYAIDAEHDSY